MKVPSHFSQNNEQTPKTEGLVLHSARSYDFFTNMMLKPSEPSIRLLSGIKPGDKILDVGCGTGSLSLVAQKWAAPGGEVTGIDASPEMIAQARKKASKQGLSATFEVGLVEDIPFPDCSFDVVLSRLMLHHLPGDLKKKGLAEMKRVLKPGGICLIVDFEPPKSGILRHLTLHMMHPLMADVDVKSYIPLIVEAGFSEVETGPTGSKRLSYVKGKKPLS